MSMKNIVINTGKISGGIHQNNGGSADQNSGQSVHKNSAGIIHKEESEVFYDVAVSYASEQEDYVSRVVKILKAEQKEVFFAPVSEREYKAKDMFEEFYKIYRYRCRYAACFISEEYRNKDYTMHEFHAALGRKQNCMIPIYFGRTGMRGLDPDISYLQAESMCEVEIADKILEIIT